MKIFRHARPKMESRARTSGLAPCEAEREDWLCTREEGHQGKHQAGSLGGRVYAEWS